MQMLHELTPSISLDELSAFIAVAECHGFNGAAVRLKKDASVISRRIGRLEKKLGIRLFSRTTRHVSLTEAGSAFFKRIRAALEQIQEAASETSALVALPQGTLKIALPITLGQRWIMPRMRLFMSRYPHIRIEAHFADRIVDLVSEGYDVAIRAGKLTDSSLLSRGIARFRYHLFASPEYLEQNGTPSSPGQLRQHVCLGFIHHATWPEWELTDGENIFRFPPESPLIADNSEALLRAAVDGIGIVQIPHWLAQADIREGKLRQILTPWQSVAENGIYAVMPPGRLVPEKTRVFIEFIISEIQTGGDK